jgi:hypothetical protein
VRRHCGVNRENLIKVLLVTLHLRHFQEFLGDLCDHFIVTKRGVSNQTCCNFMENNIMLKQKKTKKTKIPLACATQIFITKKKGSTQIDHPSHIMCACLVCVYECDCVCCVCCVCLCVVYNFMYVYLHMCVCVCVHHTHTHGPIQPTTEYVRRGCFSGASTCSRLGISFRKME